MTEPEFFVPLRIESVDFLNNHPDSGHTLQANILLLKRKQMEQLVKKNGEKVDEGSLVRGSKLFDIMGKLRPVFGCVGLVEFDEVTG